VFLLLLSGTLDAALDFWGFFLFGYANQRIVRSLRVDLFRRLLGQEVAFFDVHSSGELSSRLNSDCSEMAGDLTWFFRFSIEAVVRITGITAYMLIRSPVLGACALSIIPAVAVINKLYGDWLRQNAVKVQDALAEANSVAQEALANVRTVIAFVAESKECQRYESRIERQYQLNIKQLYMTALYYMGKST
jgi:ABC-type multidrug transport system fused ATPase/permease subunit